MANVLHYIRLTKLLDKLSKAESGHSRDKQKGA